MNKYEKLIEYIIAEQEDLARQLFHEIVVEKSRHIYESLSEADDDMMGMDRSSPVDDLMTDVEADENPNMDMGGDDEEDMDMGDDEDMDMDDEEDMDMDDDEEDMDMSDDEEDMGDEDLEDRVVDLESALDELKAEFDALMADKDGDDDEDMEENLIVEPGHGSQYTDSTDMMSDPMRDQARKEKQTESRKNSKIREYVEKVGAPANAEGHEVGAGKSVPVQKASPGLQKANDMGGKAFHLGKDSEAAPDGQRPHGKASGFVKPAQEVDVARRNVNKPGGNKGAQDFYGTKAKAKSGEEGGVNKHSIEPGSK